MGLLFDAMVQIIAFYANRNRLVHAPIEQLGEPELWDGLKATLLRDLRDLSVVTPLHLCGNIPLLQVTINSVVDHYFNRESDFPHSRVYWMPKKEMFVRAKEVRARKQKKTEAKLEYRLNIEETAAYR